MRKHSRSLLIYILFGIVIAVFIINFGPSSQGQGCAGGMAQSYAAKVHGSTIPEQDFVQALTILGFEENRADPTRSRRIREFLMDALIARELLAEEAEQLGLGVSDEEAEDQIAMGNVGIAGREWNLARDPRFTFIFKDGFDYTHWKRTFCENFLHTTPRRFIESQKRELLAKKASDLMLGATKVSGKEAEQAFTDRETKVKLAFVRFSARRFEEELDLKKADVDQYLSQHKDKVQAQYKTSELMYKAVPKEAHLRVIAWKSDKEGAHDDLLGRAKSTLERLHGGASFETLAKELNHEPGLKARSGDLGWRRKGATGFGAAFDDAVFALKPHDLSEPIKTEDGYAIARVEAYRQGDLLFDAVQYEIAEQLLRQEKSALAAKQAAEAALKKLKAGESLEALFPKATESEKAEPGKEKPANPTGPTVEETELIPRRAAYAYGDGALPGIGRTQEGADAAFRLKKDEVAGPFALQDSQGSYVLFKVVEKKEPDWADFQKRKESLLNQFAAEKHASLMSDFIKDRCVKARQDGKIRVNLNVLSLGEGEPVPYTPCAGSEFR